MPRESGKSPDLRTFARAFGAGVKRAERSLIARPSLRLQCRRIRCTFSPAAGKRADGRPRPPLHRRAGERGRVQSPSFGGRCTGCRLRAIKRRRGEFPTWNAPLSWLHPPARSHHVGSLPFSSLPFPASPSR